MYGQAVGEESEMGQIIGYVGTITDTTEQKEIEQCLLQQQQEAMYGVEQSMFLGGCAPLPSDAFPIFRVKGWACP